MILKIKWVFLLILLWGSVDIWAQKQWSLQECIEYASFNNPDIQIQALNIEMQEQNVLQSRMNMLPSLSANANGALNFGKTIDRFTNEFADSRVPSINLFLQSSVTLFSGFQLLNTVKRQNLELMARNADLQSFYDMKALEITTAYLQILYGKENFDSRKQQAKLTQMQLSRTRQLVEAGTLAEGDLFNMEAQYASDLSLQIQAENDLDLAYLSLKQLLNLPADTAFDVQTPLFELSDSPSQLLAPEVVYNYAVDNRPEVTSALYRYEVAQKDLAISRGAFYPTLSLSAGIGTGYSGLNEMIDGTPQFNGFIPNGNITSANDTVFSPTFLYSTIRKPMIDQFDENTNYSIGLNLSIPLFSNYRNRSQNQISKLALQQAELNVEKAKIDLRKTIEQAYADAKAAYNSYSAAKKNVEALAKAHDYAKKKYNAGLISSYDYNLAKINYENAKNDMLNAKFNYVFRIKVLDFYYGKPLTF
jgi:outer membrane protein